MRHRFLLAQSLDISYSFLDRQYSDNLSSTGLYPIVGWKIGGETVYLAEGNAAGCGTAMEWAHQMGAYFTVMLINTLESRFLEPSFFRTSR